MYFDNSSRRTLIVKSTNKVRSFDLSHSVNKVKNPSISSFCCGKRESIFIIDLRNNLRPGPITHGRKRHGIEYTSKLPGGGISQVVHVSSGNGLTSALRLAYYPAIYYFKADQPRSVSTRSDNYLQCLQIIFASDMG